MVRKGRAISISQLSGWLADLERKHRQIVNERVAGELKHQLAHLGHDLRGVPAGQGSKAVSQLVFEVIAARAAGTDQTVGIAEEHVPGAKVEFQRGGLRIGE